MDASTIISAVSVIVGVIIGNWYGDRSGRKASIIDRRAKMYADYLASVISLHKGLGQGQQEQLSHEEARANAFIASSPYMEPVISGLEMALRKSVEGREGSPSEAEWNLLVDGFQQLAKREVGLKTLQDTYWDWLLPFMVALIAFFVASASAIGFAEYELAAWPLVIGLIALVFTEANTWGPTTEMPIAGGRRWHRIAGVAGVFGLIFSLTTAPALVVAVSAVAATALLVVLLFLTLRHVSEESKERQRLMTKFAT